MTQISQYLKNSPPNNFKYKVVEKEYRYERSDIRSRDNITLNLTALCYKAKTGKPVTKWFASFLVI